AEARHLRQISKADNRSSYVGRFTQPLLSLYGTSGDIFLPDKDGLPVIREGAMVFSGYEVALARLGLYRKSELMHRIARKGIAPIDELCALQNDKMWSRFDADF